ncbi:hypothetical protein CIPAW_13G085700 [Carya illinoinensis]|uniref:GRF-type domain-containing protein n=1 Tax=Carya illinoinensis TaxID=32201 RepID=A0A8T1NNR6_CARIL|nr:hypothetical protein CIPAW_13G085700 [Carya illinoinensis]
MLSEGDKVSSSVSSSSISYHTLRNNPICNCGSPASLKWSNTPRNPGRSFFGCSKYNTKGLPHCNFFIWADSGKEIENDLMKLEIEILMKKEELQKTHEELQKTHEEVRKLLQLFRRREEEVRRREEEVQKMMEEVRRWMEEVRLRDGEIVKREVEVRRQRTHIRIYWAVSILLYLYLIRSH